MFNESMHFGIDLGRYQTMFIDTIDDAIQKFEENVLYDLADSIVRVESPHYFDSDGDVDEGYYDEFSEAIMCCVNELGKHIFGEYLYGKYSCKGDENEQ